MKEIMVVLTWQEWEWLVQLAADQQTTREMVLVEGLRRMVGASPGPAEGDKEAKDCVWDPIT